MSSSIANSLSIIDLFEGLTDTQLELVAALGELITMSSGETLFRENDRSDELYIILRGSVLVRVNPGLVGHEGSLESVTIADLGAGQIVGELALVDQGLRSATAMIDSDGTQLLRIPRDRFMRLCDSYPELGYKVMKNMAGDLAWKMRNTGLTMRQYLLMLYRRSL